MKKFLGKKQIGQRRGYTATELIVAVGIFSIGVTGIAGMQRVSAGSNMHARALATATAVAQSWQERLAIDATQWTQTQDISNTRWLSTLSNSTNEGNWTLPAYLDGFGAAFDALGRPVDESAAPEDVVFCSHARVTELFPEIGETQGSGLLRVEVRVFWPNPGVPWNNGAAYCAAGASIPGIGVATDNFNFVYKTTAIRQTAGL